VAWDTARAADALGVDIIENCEVTGIVADASGAVEGVETRVARSRPARRRGGGRPHQRHHEKMAGIEGGCPLESYPLQGRWCPNR